MIRDTHDPPKHLYKVLVGLVAAILLGVFLIFFDMVRPGHDGVVLHRVFADGTEAMVIQSHNNDWVEPYFVSFCILLDDQNEWRIHYLDHEAVRWLERQTRIELDPRNHEFQIYYRGMRMGSIPADGSEGTPGIPHSLP